MSMLTLRQVPLRFSALRRVDWPSPARVPRSWLTGLFVASATYAMLMALVTSHPLHRTWGIFAACSYLLAAMVVLVFKARGVDSALPSAEIARRVDSTRVGPPGMTSANLR